MAYPQCIVNGLGVGMPSFQHIHDVGANTSAGEWRCTFSSWIQFSFPTRSSISPWSSRVWYHDSLSFNVLLITVVTSTRPVEVATEFVLPDLLPRTAKPSTSFADLYVSRSRLSLRSYTVAGHNSNDNNRVAAKSDHSIRETNKLSNGVRLTIPGPEGKSQLRVS